MKISYLSLGRKGLRDIIVKRDKQIEKLESTISQISKKAYRLEQKVKLVKEIIDGN